MVGYMNQLGHDLALVHSAKGTTWEEHKYIRRIDGTYYYPDDYVGGRHISSLNNSNNSNSDEKDENGIIGDAYSRGPDDLLSKDEIISSLYDITGMKEEGLNNLLELYQVSMELGISIEDFMSKDNDMLWELAEGDPDHVEKMMAILQRSEPEGYKLSDQDVENLAQEVIRGNFGNGQVRKDLLGENYQQVQDRVNEIMRSNSGSTKISSVSKEEIDPYQHVIDTLIERHSNTSSSSGNSIDFDTIYDVYRRR